MSSIPIPAEVRSLPRPLPGMWARLSLGVLAAGCALGGFLAASARTEANAPYLMETSRRWIELCSQIPLLGIPISRWHQTANPQLELVFPGLVVGGFGGVFFWLFLGIAAAWQNSCLFPRALKHLGWSLIPLLLYFPLIWITGPGRSWLGHWCMMIPFASSAFLLARVSRRIQREALGGALCPAGNGVENNLFATILVWVVSLAVFWIWAGLSFLRYNNFHNGDSDLALIGHSLNQFIVGEGMNSSLLPYGGSPLVQPLSPILFLLSPLYYFGPHLETLLLLQATMVAFATIPFFHFTRQYLGNCWAACGIALCYLFMPGLSEGIYSGFHSQSLAPFLFFWLAWETVRPGSRRWWLPLVLVWLVGETLCLYTLVWGFFLLVRAVVSRNHPSRSTSLLMAAAVILLSLLYPCILYGYLQTKLFPEATAEAQFVGHYKDFIPEWLAPARKGIPGLIKEIASNPLIALSLIFDPQRLEVFMRFWGGTFFLPLWNPLAWFPLVAVVEKTLSSEGALYTWTESNGFSPVMASAVAMVVSLALLRRWRLTRGWITPLSWVMLFSSVVWWMGDSHLPTMGPPPCVRFSVPMAPEGTAKILRVQLPMGKSVSAQTHLLPHLTQQAALYPIPPSIPVPVEGIADDAPQFERLRPAAGWPDYLILDRESPCPQAWDNSWSFDKPKILLWINWLVQTERYRKTLEQGSLEIYERSGVGP